MSITEIPTEKARLIPWIHRIPEPIEELETADEYTALAENTFAESDKAFAYKLSRFIPRGARIIDVGSGPAFQDIELAKLKPDSSIILVDYNPQMLEKAKHKAELAGVSRNLSFKVGDMTKLNKLDLGTDNFVISNTAIHEIRTMDQLSETFAGIADLVGIKGGCIIKDLLRPASEEQATDWREEVLQGATLSDRELKLFKNSQKAGFSLQEVRDAINSTDLKRRGTLTHLKSPDKRYWVYQVKTYR